ncbi:MAG: hypothetical protein V4730_07175 [Pseudomonadota bacterium]
MIDSNLLLTIDRNVIISVINEESGFEFAKKLFNEHNNGNLSIAVSAANRVENNKKNEKIQSISVVIDMCRDAGLILSENDFLDYPLDWEMGLWEHGLIGKEEYELELKIHNLLFPSVLTFRSEDQPIEKQKKITNAKCDVFALWGHIYHKRDYFVTNDRNFHKKKAKLERLGANRIIFPKQMLELVSITKNT